MNIGLLLVIILVLVLVLLAGNTGHYFGGWGPGYGYGLQANGLLGAIIVIVLILFLLGRI